MNDNYPNGTWALDPNAPWNQTEDRLQCPACGYSDEYDEHEENDTCPSCQEDTLEWSPVRD